MDRVTSLILKADGNWKHDDSNNSSSELLDVSTALVSGTKKYAISVTWLKIARVRVKDSAGNLITLDYKDRIKMTDEELNATSGTPKTCYRLGNYIYVNPAPNYSVAAGLELQYQRGPSYFAVSDTTKVPGFASTFHRLVPLYASLDYTDVNDLNTRSAKIQARITQMEAELQLHYSTRNDDEQANISLRKEDFGESALV